MTISACYSYGYYFGGLFIYHSVINDISGNDYNSGDIVAIFFGVIFGMFSMGMAGSNIKAVTEGKVAGKMAFDIIERIPPINLEA
jgi:hypothetical protein